ncbi:SGNH/GDSL hydrolase family protein [Arthrobacter wenxiniae]|uniref:SGNH/GDSL hydrolase family protein n=1 Tax=Arthrobacter wenxiniae TaxID=2713570 RepID=A0A7Y7IJL3_9MICC|nr:SGNH/GDSL hydrolase family protein [Arthrobacter wenxiniae]NVM96507.1 SGNH/GDSL hydrolase family protein [Arthrobacter wenxiniae]
MAVAMVVLVAVGVGAAAHAGVPAAVPVKTVHVDTIGDSLSAGYKTPGNTWPGQAQALLAAKGRKAEITNASENGAGYVRPGELGDLFLDLVNRAVNSQSQLVVLFGSDNDAGAPGLAAAAQDLAGDLEHPNAAGETYLAQHMSAIMAPVIRSAAYRDRLRRR